MWEHKIKAAGLAAEQAATDAGATPAVARAAGVTAKTKVESDRQKHLVYACKQARSKKLASAIAGRFDRVQQVQAEAQQWQQLYQHELVGRSCWTSAEVLSLSKAVALHGRNWNAVSMKVGRTSNQCLCKAASEVKAGRLVMPLKGVLEQASR